MSKAWILRFMVALAISVAVGALGLYQMFSSEVATTSDFTLYFDWAKGAGLVFLAIGAALTLFGREDVVVTELDKTKK